LGAYYKLFSSGGFDKSDFKRWYLKGQQLNKTHWNSSETAKFTTRTLTKKITEAKGVIVVVFLAYISNP